MKKTYLRNREFIPTMDILQKIIGSRWGLYKQILHELSCRNLKPEMCWYGKKIGWSPKFCAYDVMICGVSIMQSPLIGLIGIGNKIGFYMEKDKELEKNAKDLYDLTVPRGPIRWMKVDIETGEDLRVFLSLVDSKIKALSRSGYKVYESLILPEIYKKDNDYTSYQIKEDFSKICVIREKIQEGPPSHYTAKVILAAGRG